MTVRAPRRSWGWLGICGFVVVHNVGAAGRGYEMLSDTAQRYRRRHPVIVPLASLLLWGHLMGWLGRGDPLFYASLVLTKLVGARPEPRTSLPTAWERL